MTEQPTAAPELSVADFKAMFNKAEAPTPQAPVAPAATATPEAPKTTEPEAIATPEAETTTETTEPERDENGRFKAKDAAEEPATEPDADDLPKNVQKRIGKAVAKQREAERKAEALEARLAALEATRDRNPQPETPAPVGKPKLDDFDSVEEFTDALTDWKLARRDQQEKQKEQAKSIEQKVSEARKQYPDFDNIAFSQEVVALIDRNRPVGDVITASPIFAKLAMYLGENTSELERIVALPLTRVGPEIGKIEAKLSTPKAATNTPKPPAQPLPKPPVQLNTSNATEPKPQSEWTPAEWRAHFAARNRF